MKRATRAAGTSVYVALLRAVNVGGNNKLPMRDLAEIFSAAGADAVRTYIQSGNVVFSAPAAVAGKLPGTVPKLIAKRFGFEPPLVLRSAQQLVRIAVNNPFLDGNTDVSSLYVGFLADPPEPERAAKLNPQRSPGDRFALVGQQRPARFGTGARC
jgi:uncharacterized protein (DUF1697 family)